jgi:hypothetical protein
MLKMKTIFFTLILAICGLSVFPQGTGITDLNYSFSSTFTPTIKDAVKQSDLPEISDTVKKIDKITYSKTKRSSGD